MKSNSMIYNEQLDTLAEEYNALSSTTERDLSNIELRLNEIKADYSRMAHYVKPIFTIPYIFRRTYDENFISDYLSYILHPIESGLGFAPLQALLSLADFSIEPRKLGHEINEIVVEREVQLSEHSRIDILIHLKSSNIIIAIENKIFSLESEKQTIRYSEEIQKLFPDCAHFLFYLTPYGKPAKSLKFKPISYDNLLTAFRSFQPKQLPERELFIYNDFLLHVENYIMKSVNLKLTEKAILYLKNYDMITDLQNAFSKDTSNIFEVVSEIIKGTFDGLDNGFETSFSKDRDWQVIYKDHWKKMNLWIHFEFDFTKDSLFTNSGFHFMVDVEGKDENIYLERFDKIQRKLKNNYKTADIQYRPVSRRNAIAFKEYNFKYPPDNLDRSEVESFFQKTINEFIFLADPIDQVLDNT
jgi:PD-(D/E)XK nuclease superfamily